MIELVWEYMFEVAGPYVATFVVFGIVFALVFGISRRLEFTIPMLFITMVLLNPLAHFPTWVWFIWALVLSWTLGVVIWNQLS